MDGGTITTDVEDDKDVVARIFIHPARFFDTVAYRDFGFGLAASSGQRSPGSAVAGYKSSGQQTATSYKSGTSIQDNAVRIAPQAYLYDGPFSLLSEYVRSTDFATNTGNVGDNQVAILGREAWQVSAGWVLTGEDAAFGGPKWDKVNTGAWGLWQLVGRYQVFQVDSANVHLQDVDGPNVGAAGQRFVDPRKSATKIQGWGLGLNWLPTPNTKVYLDFEQNKFTDGASQNAAGVYNGASPNKTIDRETERLERRLLFLATVGSAAPFIGLFGTVWGIMTSFQAISASKNTSLAVVAPGIAEALLATALGLLAAIPAVIAYNKLSNEAGKIGQRLEGFADEFSAILSRQADERT